MRGIFDPVNRSPSGEVGSDRFGKVEVTVSKQNIFSGVGLLGVGGRDADLANSECAAWQGWSKINTIDFWENLYSP